MLKTGLLKFILCVTQFAFATSGDFVFMLVLISLLSDGVVDVLVICMAVWVSGTGAKGRYSLTRLVCVFNTLFFNLF